MDSHEPGPHSYRQASSHRGIVGADVGYEAIKRDSRGGNVTEGRIDFLHPRERDDLEQAETRRRGLRMLRNRATTDQRVE